MIHEEIINLDTLSIRELEEIVGRPTDDVRVRNDSVVCEFGLASGAITRVHIAKK